MSNVDRRVRRTRRRLRDALIELVMEMGYDAITIKNITDRADLSRATFYLHYDDKDTLLVESLETMFDELVAALNPSLLDEEKTKNNTTPGELAFRHVAEYSDLYKALLLGDRGVTYVIYREIQYIARIAEQQIQALIPAAHPPEALAVPVEIIAQHIAGALFSMILWWLEHDMPHSPEAMGRMFHQMSQPAVHSALNLPPDTPAE